MTIEWSARCSSEVIVHVKRILRNELHFSIRSTSLELPASLRSTGHRLFDYVMVSIFGARVIINSTKSNEAPNWWIYLIFTVRSCLKCTLVSANISMRELKELEHLDFLTDNSMFWEHYDQGKTGWHHPGILETHIRQIKSHQMTISNNNFPQFAPGHKLPHKEDTVSMKFRLKRERERGGKKKKKGKSRTKED